MAIDNSGISSLDAGAGEITYSGNEGPKSPQQEQQMQMQQQQQQQQMMMAQLEQEYEQYRMEQIEIDPSKVLSFEEWYQATYAASRQGVADGGRTGYQSGKSVKPLGISDEEWERMLGLKGPRPLSSQSPYLSVHADGGRTGFQGGGADYMPTDPGPMGNPAVMEEIEDMREFRIANPNIKDVGDYAGETALMKQATAMVEAGVVKNREEAIRMLLQKKMHGVQFEPNMAYGGTAKPTYTQSRKQNLAYGGIAGLDGRKAYGIGSWYQKYIKDPIEMVLTGKTPAQLEQESQARVDAEDAAYGEGYENPIDTWFKGTPDPGDPDKRGDSLTDRLGLTDGDNGKSGAGNYLIPMAIGAVAGKTQADWLRDNPSTLPAQQGIDIAGIRSRALTGSDPGLHFLPKGEATTAYAQGGRTGYYAGDRVQQNMITAFSDYKNAGGREDFNGWFSDIYLPETAQQTRMGEPMDIEDWREEPMDIEGWRGMAAQGGRIGAQEGGLMNLGGMEKDYRQEGGFVPLGGEERADDVPARLSKNEFVFTADAVRAAGGGDIDAGAEIMENLMENLEQGGQVSEESQGLEGARDMFSTAQRLEGVL